MKGPFRFLIGCYFLLVNSKCEPSAWETHDAAGTARGWKATSRVAKHGGAWPKAPPADCRCATQLNVIQKEPFLG